MNGRPIIRLYTVRGASERKWRYSIRNEIIFAAGEIGVIISFDANRTNISQRFFFIYICRRLLMRTLNYCYCTVNGTMLSFFVHRNNSQWIYFFSVFRFVLRSRLRARVIAIISGDDVFLCFPFSRQCPPETHSHHRITHARTVIIIFSHWHRFKSRWKWFSGWCWRCRRITSLFRLSHVRNGWNDINETMNFIFFTWNEMIWFEEQHNFATRSHIIGSYVICQRFAAHRQQRALAFAFCEMQLCTFAHCIKSDVTLDDEKRPQLMGLNRPSQHHIFRAQKI